MTRTEPGSVPVVDNTTPALAHSWHAVARADELGAGTLGIRLLDHAWTLERRGDRIAAGPGRPWGVQERYGLVWLAPCAPHADLHDFHEWDDAGFDRAFTTTVRTPVSAAQLVDNFLDAAHFPFVHADTFGVDESALVHDRGVERDGWFVRTTFDTWYRNFDDPLVATGEHPEVQRQNLVKIGSASFTVLLRLGFPVTGATFTILFCCQPETRQSTRVYKLLARDDLGGDPERMRTCIADEDRILAEDLALLERYERMELHTDLRVEVHTRADRLSVAYRRLLGDLLTEHADDGALAR